MSAALPTAEFSPLRFESGALVLLDQTLLPREERWLRLDRVEAIADAIRRLAVRGAPAIGIAAAYGLVVALLDEEAPGADLAGRFEWASALLGATRPTAVNLRWALAEGARAFAPLSRLAPLEAAARLLDWARALHADDVARNRRISAFGAALFAPGDRALTHCNAGALATGGIGTALGVLVEAHRQGRLASVWVDETRPLLQGARLTAWELLRAGVPHRLVTDSMVGALDEPRPGRPRRGRRRPHRRERRLRQQDRHLHRRRARPPPRRPVLRRGAALDLRPGDGLAAPGSRSRSAPAAR